jgi:hypothetical protein
VAAKRVLEARLSLLRVAAGILGDKHRLRSDVPERERLSDDVARPHHKTRAVSGEARVEVAERVEQKRGAVRPREPTLEDRLVEDEQRHDLPGLVRCRRQCGVVVHA